MSYWPATISAKKIVKTYKCQHCDARFEKRQSLGGHAVKMHKGQSPTYVAKKMKRQLRTRARAIHAVAKSLHFAMKSGELDELTANTFAWIKNRPTAAEREQAVAEADS